MEKKKGNYYWKYCLKILPKKNVISHKSLKNFKHLFYIIQLRNYSTNNFKQLIFPLIYNKRREFMQIESSSSSHIA